MDKLFLLELDRFLQEKFIGLEAFAELEEASDFGSVSESCEKISKITFEEFSKADSFEELDDFEEFDELSELEEHFDIPGVDKVYPTFAETLFKLIDSRKISDGEACRFSGIDRRVLSKIRTNSRYTPTKRTIFAFSMGLKLTEDEVIELLMKAGYAFSNTSKTDIIVQYFIKNKHYDMFELDEALVHYGEPTIGC